MHVLHVGDRLSDGIGDDLGEGIGKVDCIDDGIADDLLVVDANGIGYPKKMFHLS